MFFSVKYIKTTIGQELRLGVFRILRTDDIEKLLHDIYIVIKVISF